MFKLRPKSNLSVLSKYLTEYPAWDPMLIKHKGRWFIYVLATKKKKTDGFNPAEFFTEDNYIHGFASQDLISWEDLGPIIVGRNDQERICAGSLFEENGTIYFFYSVNVAQFSSGLLDQRVALATSTDGINYKINDEFNLLPSKKMYGTKRQNPKTGEMLFAWRDPYIFKDPKSGKYYLFICAGGVRWGVCPQIAVAVSDNIAGSYELLPPAAEPKINVNGNAKIAMGEIERVQVYFFNDKYYMLFSGWQKDVSEELVEACKRLGYRITDSAIYVLSSKNVIGPYEFELNSPIVENSQHTGFYGSWLVSSLIQDGQYYIVGWYPHKFEVNVTNPFQFIQQDGCFYINNDKRLIVKKLKRQIKDILGIA